MFPHHLQRGFHPPFIDLHSLPGRELIAAHQPRLAVSLETLDPALDSAKTDTQFGCLIGVSFIERPIG